MEREPLLRTVSALQACIRGYLVRRQFQSLRAEYEAVVQEIDGDLDTLQWTEGCIPRPLFLPKKAKSHWSRQHGEGVPDLKEKQWNHVPGKESEKEAVWEKKMLEKKGESSEHSDSLLCRDYSSQLQQEQSRKPSLKETRKSLKMENPDASGPMPPHSQTELQELQNHRSHLAMELLWLQQAINSRKEYLVLKQTLKFPEVDQTRDKSIVYLDHRRQACETARSQSSPSMDDQPYRDRHTLERGHTDDSYWRLSPQSHESLERLTCTDDNTAGTKYRNLGHRRAGPQLSTPSDDQALEDRLTNEASCEEHILEGTCLQLTEVFEGRNPKGLCSGKMRTQPLHENLSHRDRPLRGTDHKELDHHGARPHELDLSEDRIFQDESLAGPEHRGLDLRRTKPPTGQTRSSQEDLENQRTVPQKSKPLRSCETVFHGVPAVAHLVKRTHYSA